MPSSTLLRGLMTVVAIADVHAAEILDAFPPPLSPEPGVVHVPTAPYPRRWRGRPTSRYPSRKQIGDLPLDAPINFKALGYQDIRPDLTFRPRHQYAQNLHPWHGLPEPTPMGPYAQRRPFRPPAPPAWPLPEPAAPLAPLRDIDLTEKSTNKAVSRWPHDTWQGAQDPGHVVRPPSLDALRDLVPPHMRANFRAPKGANHPPDPAAAVGYVPEPKHSEETVRVTRTTTRPSRVFLWRPPTPVRPPELLDVDEDTALFLQEPAPEDPVSTDEEPPRRRAGHRPPKARSHVESHIYNSFLL